MFRARTLLTLHRPAVVSEFQRASVESTRSRWQAFKILTWVATGAAGAVMLTQTYPGSEVAGGRHALSGVQERLRAAYEDFLMASIDAPQPPSQGRPAPPQPEAGKSK